jgi:EmrB/QacA subfamily drug resistance transporter
MIATAHTPHPPSFTHEQIIRVMWGVALCIFLSALDQTIVVPAVPAMAGTLKGFGQLSWIVSAYLLTSTAATPILGKLSDSYGRRNLLLLSIVIFTASSLLCAIATSLMEMVLFRALQGIGGAGLIAMSHATIADVASPRERGRYQLYLSGTWGVASVIGPLTGGYLTDHLSWRAIFWINLPLGIVTLLLTMRALSILPRRTRRSANIDYPGAALLTIAVTAGLLLLSWGGNDYDWTSWPILGLALLSAASVTLLSRLEQARPDPLFPGRLFRNGVAVSGFALSFCNAVCMLGATFVLPLYFQFMRGADASSSGALLMPFLLAFVILSYFSGRMATRLGRTKWLMVAASLITATGLVLLATAGEETGQFLIMFYIVLTGGGIGLIQPCITMTVQNAVETRDLGVATSGTLLFRMIGGAFGATLVGAIVTGRFNSRMNALGVPSHATLGTMRAGTASMSGTAGISQTAIESALTSGFHFAFLGCAAISIVGFVIALIAKDPMLRTTSYATPQAE